MSFVDFSPPSYRAASSDLTISISPLGLVELADEEFEVHGPRLNRYSLNWAMYLGHHWGYRREQGEMQIGGVIYPDSPDKAARFILNCNQKKIPLVQFKRCLNTFITKF